MVIYTYTHGLVSLMYWQFHSWGVCHQSVILVHSKLYVCAFRLIFDFTQFIVLTVFFARLFILFVYLPFNWQISLWYLILYHLQKCDQATVLSPTHNSATTSTLELLSTSVASSLTQVMPSLVTSTRTGWWSEMGTWWTQHWQKQSFQPPRRVSSCSSSTSNQSMMVSTTALPTQVIQMKRCPVTCTSMDQVRTACGHEVEGPWGDDAAFTFCAIQSTRAF